MRIGIVGGLTIGLTALAVHLHVGIPGSDETQIANLARGNANAATFWTTTAYFC